MVFNLVSYYRLVSYSYVGMVCKVNEDVSFDVFEVGFWVVVDGMGGYVVGDFVSSLIVDILWCILVVFLLLVYVGVLCIGFVQVNEWVCQEVGLCGVSVMGSILVLFVVCGNQVSCLWVGDSCLYCLCGGVLEVILWDYSYVQELFDNVLISEEEVCYYLCVNVVICVVGVYE